MAPLVRQPLRARADAMVERVALEAGYTMGPAAGAVVADAVRTAIAARDVVVDDDHDPRLLHPARTVLILLSDDECRDADVLVAAAFVESLDEPLRVENTAVAAAGDRALRLSRAVPLPRARAALVDAASPAATADEDLLERLVSVEPAAAVVALAEMLDHARHLHLRPALNWRGLHGLVTAAYIPAAARLSPQVGRRLQRWADSFGARRLTGPGLRPAGSGS